MGDKKQQNPPRCKCGRVVGPYDRNRCPACNEDIDQLVAKLAAAAALGSGAAAVRYRKQIIEGLKTLGTFALKLVTRG